MYKYELLDGAAESTVKRDACPSGWGRALGVAVQSVIVGLGYSPSPTGSALVLSMPNLASSR